MVIPQSSQSWQNFNNGGRWSHCCLSKSSSRLYQEFQNDDEPFRDEDEDNGDGESSPLELPSLGDDDFSDFGFVVGEDAGSSSSTDGVSPFLEQRFQAVRSNEQAAQQQIADNRSQGYWGTWGCSLDPGDADSKTIVTFVARCSEDEDDDDEDGSLLVVGRSDGSLCWLHMMTTGAPSESAAPSDTDPNRRNRSFATTYFENKLGARATETGGMILETSLQRQQQQPGGTDDYDAPQPQPPFEILAQISNTADSTAILDILPLSSVHMVWTISQDTPHSIQGWNLVRDSETELLLPLTNSLPIQLPTNHTAPIVGMKAIPQSSSNNYNKKALVVSVSDNGQVVIWEATANDTDGAPEIAIRFDATLRLREDGEDEDDEDEDEDLVVLSMAVDEDYLYLGTSTGRILVHSWSSDLRLVTSFRAFASSGVSALLPTKSLEAKVPKELIAGSTSGELKQWQLIPVRDRLEHWPKMPSQTLTGGKIHVYKTTTTANHCIRALLLINEVLVAATDHDLTAWDTISGTKLYNMVGFDFSRTHRPCLVAENGSVLVTNGMEQFVCVHDFGMDRWFAATEDGDDDTDDEFWDRD